MKGAPSGIYDIVVCDDVGLVEGGSSDAIVIATRNGRVACARDTGQRVALPAEVEPAHDAAELLVAGKRLRVRERAGKRELVRVHADGSAGTWTEQIAVVGKTGQVVTTEKLAIHVEDYADHHGISRLGARIVGADGIADLVLPSWIIDGAPWGVHVLARARVVVFVSPRRVAWLTYETIAALYATRPRYIKLRAAVPGGGGDGEVVVTRTDRSGTFVEGGNGRRIMLNRPLVAVSVGERLTITTIKGVYALVNAAGATVAREDKIEMVRTVDARAEQLQNTDVNLRSPISPGQTARSLVTDHVRAGVERLHTLGIAPALDRAALDDAITDAYGGGNMLPSKQVAIAKILHAHFLAHRSDRVLVGKDAIERASRAGAGWHLVMMDDYQPFAIRLSADEQAKVIDEALLVLEPVPPYIPPPADAAEVHAALVELLGCAPSEITLTPDPKRVRLSLTIRAAALLEQRMPYRD